MKKEQKKEIAIKMADEFYYENKTDFDIVVDGEKVNIEIKGWDWHRGIIFLCNGDISIWLDDDLQDAMGWCDFSFSSKYVEFLHYGSGGYGFHLDVEYTEDITDEDINWYYETYYERKATQKDKKYVKKIQQKIDNILAEVEDILTIFCEQIQLYTDECKREQEEFEKSYYGEEETNE